MVYCPLKFTHHRDDSSAKNRYTCEIRRISRCLLKACSTGMIVRAALQTVVVWCVYSESGGSAALVLTTRFALVWFWSRLFATLQMRWIMLIHGGELCKNVCFTVWRVCVHVYSCLDNWALSNRDCGLISPSADSLGYIQTAIRATTDVAFQRRFDDWADVGRLLCWLWSMLVGMSSEVGPTSF